MHPDTVLDEGKLQLMLKLALDSRNRVHEPVSSWVARVNRWLDCTMISLRCVKRINCFSLDDLCVKWRTIQASKARNIPCFLHTHTHTMNKCETSKPQCLKHTSTTFRSELLVHPAFGCRPSSLGLPRSASENWCRLRYPQSSSGNMWSQTPAECG